MLENHMILDQIIADNEAEDWLSGLPKCKCCHEHIQDAYYIELPDGEVLCNDCEDDNAAELWHEWGREQFLVINEGI